MDAANTASLTVGDIMGLMEAWYPASTAEPWDKVGLICGDPGHRASSVLLALDPVDAVAQQAREGGFDMVITHHPLLLRGASFLPVTDPKGSVISHLIRSDIALFNAHTNADVAHLGVAEALAAIDRPLLDLLGSVPDAGADDEAAVSSVRLARSLVRDGFPEARHLADLAGAVRDLEVPYAAADIDARLVLVEAALAELA